MARHRPPCKPVKAGKACPVAFPRIARKRPIKICCKEKSAS